MSKKVSISRGPILDYNFTPCDAFPFLSFEGMGVRRSSLTQATAPACWKDDAHQLQARPL